MVVVFNFVVDFYWILLQFYWSWFRVFWNRLRNLLNHGALFDGRGHLIRRCSSLAFWRWRGLYVLLIYFLHVDQFCLDWAHNFILPALGPHKIDLVHFLLIVQQPPKPCLKQRPYEHTIVSFANVHFEMLDQLLFVSSQGLQSQHRVLLNFNRWLGVLVKFFVKNAWNFWVEAVGFADDSAPTGNKFFLQQVGILSAFEIGGLQLPLHQSQAKLLSQPQKTGQLLFVSRLVNSSLSENYFNKFVVLFEEHLNRVVSYFFGRFPHLYDFDLGWTVFALGTFLRKQRSFSVNWVFVVRKRGGPYFVLSTCSSRLGQLVSAALILLTIFRSLIPVSSGL